MHNQLPRSRLTFPTYHIHAGSCLCCTRTTQESLGIGLYNRNGTDSNECYIYSSGDQLPFPTETQVIGTCIIRARRSPNLSHLSKLRSSIFVTAISRSLKRYCSVDIANLLRQLIEV